MTKRETEGFLPTFLSNKPQRSNPPPMFIYTGEASFLLSLSHSHFKRSRHNECTMKLSNYVNGM